MSEEQEADLWWGSYSGWTMWPSFIACLLITASIGWLAWRFVEKDLLQLTFLGVATSLWILQFMRWGKRVFSYNYRLTNRRLFRDKGFRRQNLFNVELKSIAHVHVRQSSVERIVNVARLVIRQSDPKHPPLILEGVSQPFAVADQIREAVQKAQDAQPT
ncbi:MAG: PH domain-containing protein [Planctomycetes bacterium]|nr:PH domain-containing protein [Planctomycetota bacterium]